MTRLKLAVLAVILCAGCSLTTRHVATQINTAEFYRARYIDDCVTTHLSDVPCEQWVKDQKAVDAAAKESSDALQVGGSQPLQAKRLNKLLKNMKGAYSKWLE